jgi:hypothetical protein
MWSQTALAADAAEEAYYIIILKETFNLSLIDNGSASLGHQVNKIFLKPFVVRYCASDCLAQSCFCESAMSDISELGGTMVAPNDDTLEVFNWSLQFI